MQCSGEFTAALLVNMMNLLFVFILALMDRVFKVLAERFLASGETVVLIPKVIGLRLLQGGNTGAAFGILSGKTGLLAAISLIFSVGLVYVLVKKKFKNDWVCRAFILIAAGAIGNLYDRLFIGFVTDYLMFLFMDFPIFNFADCLVDIGVAILVIYLFTSKEESLFEE